jgi:hypothetical protein
MSVIITLLLLSFAWFANQSAILLYSLQWCVQLDTLHMSANRIAA